jgi:hypothetical protein
LEIALAKSMTLMKPVVKKDDDPGFALVFAKCSQEALVFYEDV